MVYFRYCGRTRILLDSCILQFSVQENNFHNRHQTFQIRSLCDVEYRKLNFSAYPVHVRYLKNYAFKPIVIAVSIHGN